jgi:hypothetical protein
MLPKDFPGLVVCHFHLICSSSFRQRPRRCTTVIRCRRIPFCWLSWLYAYNLTRLRTTSAFLQLYSVPSVGAWFFDSRIPRFPDPQMWECLDAQMLRSIDYRTSGLCAGRAWSFDPSSPYRFNYRNLIPFCAARTSSLYYSPP